MNFNLMITANPSHFRPCLQLLVNNCLLSGLSFVMSLSASWRVSINHCRNQSSPTGILTTFSRIRISPCLCSASVQIRPHPLLTAIQDAEAGQSSRFTSSFYRCCSKKRMKNIEKYTQMSIQKQEILIIPCVQM